MVARFLPWIRIFTFWSAGAARMRLDRFMLWNVVGAVVWVVAVASAGYLFGRSVAQVEDAIGTGGAVALVVAGVAVLGWISLRHRRALRTGG